MDDFKKLVAAYEDHCGVKPGFFDGIALDEMKASAAFSGFGDYVAGWKAALAAAQAPAPAPEQPGDLREAFEAWVQAGYPGASGKELIGKEENSPHPYVYDGIKKQWRAWKAGATWARSQAPAPAPEAPAEHWSEDDPVLFWQMHKRYAEKNLAALGATEGPPPAVGADEAKDAARFRWLIDERNWNENEDTPSVCTSEDVHWGNKARALIDRHMETQPPVADKKEQP